MILAYWVKYESSLLVIDFNSISMINDVYQIYIEHILNIYTIDIKYIFKICK